MRAITTVADHALAVAGEGPTWQQFIQYLSDAFEVGAGSLEVLAGKFPAGLELSAAAAEMHHSIARLLEYFQASGVVRPDVTANDLMQLLVMIRAVHLGTSVRTKALHRRYLSLLAVAFAASAASPLAEPPPTLDEITAAWEAGGHFGQSR